MKGIPTTNASSATLVRARLLAPILAAAIAAAVSAPTIAGNPTSSDATVCVKESDPGKRLACYDRANGRDEEILPPPASAPATRPALPAAAAPPVPSATEKVPRQVAVRVVSIERHADGFVLHLDNGQVWQHEESTPTRTDLRAGDQVTVDRSLGSYWLSGRDGPALQVTQKRESSAAP